MHDEVTTGPPEVDVATSMARAFDLLDLGFVVGDGNQVLYANAAAGRVFGRDAAELLQIGSLRTLFDPEEQERIQEIRRQAMSTGRPMPERFTTVIDRPDGTELPIELWVKAEVTDAGVRTYTFVHDIKERYAVRQELAAMAMRDALTGLPNRFVITEVLDAAVRACSRTKAVGLVLFIDLDGFKAINDTFGHHVGDDVLIATADRLSSAVRSSDTAARLGGDEFVVVCPDVAPDDVAMLISRVEAALDQPLEFDGERVDVGASVGAVTFADPDESAAAVLARADDAMYERKAARRANRS